MANDGVNLYDLRLKLFGPTLDDSVLYGIDRMIDYFVSQKENKAPERKESFYRSCEALPVLEEMAPIGQHLPPKLSADEMDIIIDAIVQSRRNSQKSARKVRTTPSRQTGPFPRLRQTRWAIARINEFDDGGKTYEIMKPLDGTALLPTVSQDTEIVFAVLQNGNTLSYRIQQQQQQQQQQLNPPAEAH
ncbi:uncharacterized protein LOC118513857 [Anopheles stephensi]|uniref:Uncharacterized protein n=1 Tax=Anopheles stephensi TaxID=30069 RepID=A0A182XZX2_ANOST|nr:uncharacterized protein LOC118513857 [Anopheles stephensi]XP_035916051.1 uncharacterized protein LOC118513857 [Anopheles stephensi]